MRNLPVIENIWKTGGPFIGDQKPVTRVFVQEPWADADAGEEDYVLRTTSGNTGVGNSAKRGLPFRWFQRQDNTQDMREIPNLQSISIDRSVDQDAALISLKLTNSWMYELGAAPAGAEQAGQPGYFTPTRGNSAEANARWGHTQNEWNDVLVPNALLRVYTGFGGATGDVLDAVAAGNLALYGIFLLDDVRIATNGTISVTGRDVAKLLIEQQLFPPLVPHAKYPLHYRRWEYDHVKVRAAKKTIKPNTTSGITNPGDKNTVYKDSSADRWYGPNASIYGHRGTDSIDGNAASYALSVGNSHPSRPFCTDWWEYECNDEMNAIYLHPWAGGYVLYVSVKEGGSWVSHDDPPADDGGVIPYDPAELYGTQPTVVDTGANIPYVAKFVVGHEEAAEFVLPRKYNAERVRVTFRNHYYSGLGAWKYRCGIREIRLRGIENVGSGGYTTETEEGHPYFDGAIAGTYAPFVMAAGALNNLDKPYSQGYVTCTNFGQSDAFGDMRRIQPAHNPQEMWNAIAVAVMPDGEGYYILNSFGDIRAHGTAEWFGDPRNTHGYNFQESSPLIGVPWDIAITPSGEGYWVLNTNGTVWCYGDATDFGANVATSDPVLCASLTSHPTEYGFWILRNDGKVFNFGATTHFGSYPTIKVFNGLNPTDGIFQNCSERGMCIRSNSDGTGYWILTSNGGVGNFGKAKGFGAPERIYHGDNIFLQSFWELLPAPDDRGYLLVHASGKISAFGDVKNFGGPVPGKEAILRSDGNYLDYTDIVRDLVLWSGFLFYDDNSPTNQPAPVYGALETTGAFADEDLPDDIFDKRPVIDAITQLKEVVGYLCWVDTEGRFRFESPNWWRIGNYNEDGEHVEVLPEIDEAVQLTEYSMSTADQSLRSSIIISSADPYVDASGMVTYNYTPPYAEKLRGLVKPAMWVNGFFMNRSEQRIMAELIGLHIAFQQRVGQLTCVASPHIEINDQVRIYERQTAEVYVHYVRGINFTHDLKKGDYKMTLTTNWLAAGTDSGNVIGGEAYPASDELQERMLLQQFAKLMKDAGGRL